MAQESSRMQITHRQQCPKMAVKTLFFIIVVVAILVDHHTEAATYYDRPQLKKSELKKFDLKCIPSLTYIQVAAEDNKNQDSNESDNDDYTDEALRMHMDGPAKDTETCEICVCSANGVDSYCSKRPARNVNECLRMAEITDKFKKNMPYDHSRDLSQSIRRASAAAPKSSCIPFLSQYSDCTEANKCSGCTECSCNSEGKWECETVKTCPKRIRAEDILEGDELDNTLDNLRDELKLFKVKRVSLNDIQSDKDSPIDNKIKENFMKTDELLRNKRSTKKKVHKRENKKDDGPIKFHNTVDELNEDTLKNTNASGMIEAKRVETKRIPNVYRRSDILHPTPNHQNSTTEGPLHIEHNHPDDIDHRMADNKVDTTIPKISEDSIEMIQKRKIKNLLGNQTQNNKIKELSKLIVNELKNGTEILGSKDAPIASNITFTSENDTLTAMTFIAGNLLNQLWNMGENSEESIDTDVLKQEKIVNLLELFKEPLNLRQENFMQAALERLSDVINQYKDPKHLSLCEVANEAKDFAMKNIDDSNLNKTGSKHCSRKSEILNKNSTIDAINKINNVLNLIKKYEKVQKNLHNSKYHGGLSDSENLTDEENSLTVFGSILQKITKLLVPSKKKSKKIRNKIGDMIFLSNSNNYLNKFKDVFKIDLENMTLSVKDRLLLDYLEKIEENPKCLIGTKLDTQSLKLEPESNLLLKLSDFIKIKSFPDLLNLLEEQKETQILRKDANVNEKLKNSYEIPSTTSTTELPKTETTTNIDSLITPTYIPSESKETFRLSSIKQKLKAHLKNLVEDLLEIQKMKGINTKPGDIKLSAALPCLYNIFTANNNKSSEKSKLVDIKNIFDTLKKELKDSPTRRSNSRTVSLEERPQAAIAWERMVKKYHKRMSKTRRSNKANKPDLTFAGLSNLLTRFEDYSSTSFKEYAYLNGVPASEKMTVLKTLEADVESYIEVLQQIKDSLDNVERLPVINNDEIQTFLQDAASNLLMNKNIMTVLNRRTSFRQNKLIMTPIPQQSMILTRTHDKMIDANQVPMNPILRNVEDSISKISRDIIVNQLIRNRIQLYLRTKEASKSDLRADLNYKVAQQVLFNLENGNVGLAREMYQTLFPDSRELSFPIMNTAEPSKPRRYLQPLDSILNKQHLVRFDEPSPYRSNYGNQDHLVKQFLSMKTMDL